MARTWNLYRLAAIVLISSCSCGCGALPTIGPPSALTATPTLPRTATPSPSPTANFKATQSAAPTATILEAANVALAQAQAWPVTFSEKFDHQASSLEAGWESGVVKGDGFSADIRVDDGQYRLDILPSGRYVHAHRAESAPQQGGSFFLAVDVQKLQGPPQTGYGLAFHWHDHQNYSLFLITSPYEFLVAELRNNRWTRSTWKLTNQIKTDQPNRICVVAKDGLFFFFINNTYVYQIEGTQPVLVGYSSLAYQVDDSGRQVVLAFDNFEIREPPGTLHVATSTPMPVNTATNPP